MDEVVPAELAAAKLGELVEDLAHEDRDGRNNDARDDGESQGNRQGGNMISSREVEQRSPPCTSCVFVGP